MEQKGINTITFDMEGIGMSQKKKAAFTTTKINQKQEKEQKEIKFSNQFITKTIKSVLDSLEIEKIHIYVAGKRSTNAALKFSIENYLKISSLTFCDVQIGDLSAEDPLSFFNFKFFNFFSSFFRSPLLIRFSLPFLRYYYSHLFTYEDARFFFGTSDLNNFFLLHSALHSPLSDEEISKLNDGIASICSKKSKLGIPCHLIKVKLIF